MFENISDDEEPEVDKDPGKHGRLVIDLESVDEARVDKSTDDLEEHSTRPTSGAEKATEAEAKLRAEGVSSQFNTRLTSDVDSGYGGMCEQSTIEHRRRRRNSSSCSSTSVHSTSSEDSGTRSKSGPSVRGSNLFQYFTDMWEAAEAEVASDVQRSWKKKLRHTEKNIMTEIRRQDVSLQQQPERLLPNMQENARKQVHAAVIYHHHHLSYIQ